MYIIKTVANDQGARPPLQYWTVKKTIYNEIIDEEGRTIPQAEEVFVCPEGYSLCPDEFYKVFYSTSPHNGFVNITVDDNNIVTSMEVNQEALDLYVSSLPDPVIELPVNPVRDLQDENRRLNAQVSAQTESLAFLEECLVEMAEVVYA